LGLTKQENRAQGRVGIYGRLISCLCVCLLALYALAAQADSVIEKSFSTQVAGGKSTAIRLDNVGVGTKLAFTIDSNGALKTLILNQWDYDHYPSIEQPLFSGTFDRQVNISVTPPAPGDYYLVFDNEQGKSPVEVNIDLKISRVDFRPLNNAALSSSMDSIVRSLGNLFIFDNIVIEPVSCGFANLVVVGDRIYLCIEYVTSLREEADDEKAAKSLLLFGILHEMGHVLLRQWDMPFHDNEELADQLATALAGMMGRTSVALEQAEFFVELASSGASGRRVEGLRRHPMAAQRAENIKRWAEAGPNHVNAWQSFLVPHMQTRFLRQLQGKAPEWANVDIIEGELLLRQGNTSL